MLPLCSRVVAEPIAGTLASLQPFAPKCRGLAGVLLTRCAYVHPRACGGNLWRGQDSNLRRQSQRVYSASPLTAREPRQGSVSLGKRMCSWLTGGRTSSVHPAGRARRHAPPHTPDAARRYDASRSCCASGSVCSFFNVRFSIWRTRSRVMLNARPTSSNVRGRPPTIP